jgi:cytochrome c oxidase subunit III
MMLALTIALLTGITVALLLIQRLRDKPWVQQGVVATSQSEGGMPAPAVGLWVFLAMVTSLFALFTAAYLMRMGGHGELIHDWHSVTKPAVLWLNTLMLVLASVAMQRARNAAESDNLVRRIDRVRNGFTLAGVLTLVFLAGQLWAWAQLQATGQYSASSPAYAFFILLTGVHGLHLIGGLTVWMKTASRVWRGLEDADLIEVGKVRLSVQLCTTYWHYLLLVWLALFALLLLT